MGIEITECEVKDFPQFGVSVTLDKCWEFFFAWSGHVGHYVEKRDMEG